MRVKPSSSFNACKLLQDAYNCANGENIGVDNYTKEEHDSCLCCTNQAVDERSMFVMQKVSK